MATHQKPPRIIRDPVSPAGVPLRACTQAERQAWIRQLADVQNLDAEALLRRPEWPAGFELVPLNGYASDDRRSDHYRLMYRRRPEDEGAWVVIERCTSFTEAVERGFIIACATRAVLRSERRNSTNS